MGISGDYEITFGFLPETGVPGPFWTRNRYTPKTSKITRQEQCDWPASHGVPDFGMNGPGTPKSVYNVNCFCRISNQSDFICKLHPIRPTRTHHHTTSIRAPHRHHTLVYSTVDNGLQFVCRRPRRRELSFGAANELRAAVCKRFLEDGRGFKAGNGGGGARRSSLAMARGVSCHLHTRMYCCCMLERYR